MIKKTALLLTLLLLATIAQAQKVKLKKDQVLLDGKAIMSYEKEMWGVHKIHLFTLDTQDELIEINNNDNETDKYYDDDFVQIRFLTQGKMVELKSNKSFKKMIEWLIKKKIIDTNGTLLVDNIDLFVKNYDENITNRTVRY